MKIATTNLQQKLPSIINRVDFIINPTEHNKNIEIFKNTNSKEITIYDITVTPKAKNKEEIHISDHINKTGHNPLIGNQKQTNTTFLDISKKYKSQTGITTHCLGDKFTTHHNSFSYPSHYTCYLYILAIATGFKTIDGRLVNILSNKAP